MSEPLNNAPRPRKAVTPPPNQPEGMSLFDYLCGCQPPLDKKIIDIVCSQKKVPTDLKHDAAQEIRMLWSQLKPDTTAFKPGQIAAYAHRMAGNAALRLRREIGSSVRLPGSAFRKRKDGSSYVTPGVLAQALDWNSLEGWFQSEGGEGAPAGTDMGGIDASQAIDLFSLMDDSAAEIAAEADPEDVARDERLGRLEAHKNELSARQYSIMRCLIEGLNYEEVMAEHGIKRGVLMREVSVASSFIGLPGY